MYLCDGGRGGSTRPYERAPESPFVRSSPRLPTEFGETIIDCVRPHCDNWFSYPEQSPTLLACALTCRAWRPRAQLNIWKAVLFMHSERIIAQFFVAARSDPLRLAPLVRTMCMHPLGEVSLGVFMGSTLPNLRVLTLEPEEVSWKTFPARASRMRLPLLASVAQLPLFACSFHTVKDVFDVVWTCASLERLTMLKCSFTREHLTDADATRLSVMRKRPGACERLTELKLCGHPFDRASTPSGSVFGSVVSKLDIAYWDLAESVDSLPPIITSYASLQTLVLTGFILDTEIWNERPALIPSLAATLSNPAILHTLVLHIETSYATDESTIDTICGPDIADIESGVSLRDVLCGLTRLEVRIAGVPFDSEKWWSTQISERLPCMRSVLAVYITKIKEVGMW
ncbi:hypothetical protein TRAPUB_1147 [Trametes pubescens]|uniref:F-box domain-containing protein n=1 Tax=Trametes pubescens TaxID=154538 RepID=A0A1M2VK46_TRAPU|nr:hypothetical protein TRAPUB_1147 [Trametes pubescens]